MLSGIPYEQRDLLKEITKYGASELVVGILSQRRSAAKSVNILIPCIILVSRVPHWGDKTASPPMTTSLSS